MAAPLTHYRQLVGMAKSWATKHVPGWDEETHRALLTRQGATLHEGRISATTLDYAGLERVLVEYERLGWPRIKGGYAPKVAGKSATQRPATLPIPPRIAHIVRLWGRLAQAGLIRVSNRQALLAFCARQTSHEVKSLDALTVAECQAITEALKSWLARGGT